MVFHPLTQHPTSAPLASKLALLLPCLHLSAVAARLSRVLADLLANPPPASLIHPVIDWTKAMGAAVRQAPLRLLLQNSDNKVRRETVSGAK